MADFLTVERAEARLGVTAKRRPRQYDEKFHVLQAPTLFLPDLDHYRKRCGMRNVPLLIAYMDIDNFKDFNSKFGETYVDLNLLPRFMAALEAHVYGRGFAYRFGGDEYAVLLPNSEASTGRDTMLRFRNRIGKIDYRGIPTRPTVSIGFCAVLPDCHFTNRELLRFVEQSKNFAKKNGRNCIATFRDANYQESFVPSITDEL
jgi:diguanylate cyclase (GGDEF)-like protein